MVRGSTATGGRRSSGGPIPGSVVRKTPAQRAPSRQRRPSASMSRTGGSRTGSRAGSRAGGSRATKPPSRQGARGVKKAAGATGGSGSSGLSRTWTSGGRRTSTPHARPSTRGTLGTTVGSPTASGKAQAPHPALIPPLGGFASEKKRSGAGSHTPKFRGKTAPAPSVVVELDDAGAGSSRHRHRGGGCCGCRCCRLCRRVWHGLRSFTRTTVWQGHTGAVTQLVVTDSSYRRAHFSRPGTVRGIQSSKWLFTAGEDGEVRQYDVHTAQCVAVFTPPDGPSAAVQHMAVIAEFVPATLHHHGGANAHSGSSAAKKHAFTAAHDSEWPGPSAGRALIVTSTADACVYMFDIKHNSCVLQLDMFRDPVTSFHLHGRVLYCGSQSGPVFEVDVLHRHRARTFTGHRGAVTDIAVVGRGAEVCSMGPPELFSASEDGTCRCIDLMTGKVNRMYRAKHPVARVYMRNKDMLLLCRNGGLKRMSRLQGDVSWEMKPLVGDVQAMQLCGQKFAYMCTSVSADASGGEIPEVVALDMVKKRVFKRYHGHKDQVTGVQVTDHQFLWTCSADSTCHCSLLKSGITALQFGSYPRQFFASLVTMLVSFGQLLSVPFVYDDSALQWVTKTLNLSFLGRESDSTSSSWGFHSKNAAVCALVLATIIVVHSDCVHRVTRRVHQARASGKRSKMKRLRLLQRLGWFLVWLMTSAGFMPVCEVLLSPIKCEDQSKGAAFVAAATTMPCGSVPRHLWLWFNMVLFFFFVPIGLRVGRLDGNAHFVHHAVPKRAFIRTAATLPASVVATPVLSGAAATNGPTPAVAETARAKGHTKIKWWQRTPYLHPGYWRAWFDWSRDHSLLRSTALIKTDKLVDGAVTCSKLFLAIMLTFSDAVDTRVAAVSFLFAVLVLLLFLYRLPYARPGANIIGGALWMGLFGTNCFAIAASTAGTFAWTPYLISLPFFLAAGGSLAYACMRFNWVPAINAWAAQCCGWRKVRRGQDSADGAATAGTSAEEGSSRSRTGPGGELSRTKFASHQLSRFVSTAGKCGACSCCGAWFAANSRKVDPLWESVRNAKATSERWGTRVPGINSGSDSDGSDDDDL